jgi:pantoate--beta-alanine ligase
MIAIASIDEVQRFSEKARNDGKTIGLVPTMGYLHEGHLSLIRKAKESCDVVVTSIFVNPTQFGPNEDFSRYPRDLPRDAELAEKAGTSVLFTPDAHAMYGEGFSTYVAVEGLSSVLEGKFRPTHFRGVTTIVSKLFLITKPHKAFFGQKDAQQCAVVKRMVNDLNFDIEIIIGPIVREADGLALSSRNVYLVDDHRRNAAVIYQSLQRACSLVLNGERDSSLVCNEVERMILSKPGISVDYVAVVNATTFSELKVIADKLPTIIAVAAHVGNTRLIDNIIVTPE